MEAFPVIHTNIWDAVWAVPVTMLVIQILKIVLDIRKVRVPLLATIVGLLLSIFIAHPKDLSAGVFMGLFYGNAAIGLYESIKITISDYRKKE